MPFCPECGKPVTAKAKFCRYCGASQIEDSQVQAGALETIPPPAPAPVPAETLCKSCNSPLDPGEKFCGSCGTRVGEQSSSSPRNEPVVTPAAPAQDATCPSCGTPFSPGTKFCGSCGAILGPTAAPAVPVPIPVSSPGNVRLCSSCGNPIKPGDKYCSKCLVKVKETAPEITQSAPVFPAAPALPAQPVQPASLPVQAVCIRQCTACGNPIKPGDTYCSKCLVKTGDTAPAAPVSTPVPPPVLAPAPAASGSYVCASCGVPLNGAEKFCGTCGAPSVGARPAAPPAAPVQKTCSKCGAPIADSTKFCGGCGAPVGVSFPSVTVNPVLPGSEEVYGIIPNVKKMKMFGASYVTYTLVITPRRMIFAQMTQAMLNTAIAEAQAKAKYEGKGFFGIVADQMAASFGFGRRYETMSPDVALAETPGNFAIGNGDIRAISLNLIDNGDQGQEWHEFRMIIDAASGKVEYIIAEDDRFTSLLQKAYGERVQLPFGLFKAGPVRVKFF
jgi:predicted amidophosphoribosyltransferase